MPGNVGENIYQEVPTNAGDDAVMGTYADNGGVEMPQTTDYQEPEPEPQAEGGEEG